MSKRTAHRKTLAIGNSESRAGGKRTRCSHSTSTDTRRNADRPWMTICEKCGTATASEHKKTPARDFSRTGVFGSDPCFADATASMVVNTGPPRRFTGLSARPAGWTEMLPRDAAPTRIFSNLAGRIPRLASALL